MASPDQLIDSIKKQLQAENRNLDKSYQECMASYIDSPTKENLSMLRQWEYYIVSSDSLSFVQKNEIARSMSEMRKSVVIHEFANKNLDSIKTDFKLLDELFANEKQTEIIRTMLGDVVVDLYDEFIPLFSEYGTIDLGHETAVPVSQLHKELIVSIDNIDNMLSNAYDNLCGGCEDECVGHYRSCSNLDEKDAILDIQTKLKVLKPFLLGRYSKDYKCDEYLNAFESLWRSFSSSNDKNKYLKSYLNKQEFTKIYEDICYFAGGGKVVLPKTVNVDSEKLSVALCSKMVNELNANKYNYSNRYMYHNTKEVDKNNLQLLPFVLYSLHDKYLFPATQKDESLNYLYLNLEYALEMGVLPKCSIFEEKAQEKLEAKLKGESER